MSQIPLRSVRLNARPATTLESFVGTAGEIFYDSTNQTLRVYPGNIAAGKILADRDWVNSAGVINYNNLTNRPTLFSGSYTDLTNKPTLFSGSYSDLINKPDLAVSYQFFVAADDSTQLLVSSDEVIKFIGAGGIATASDAEGNITITGTVPSSLVNGARTVSLNLDGALTIPGDIRSEGNINIEINLADSTRRVWQFGEDGQLTFPDGGNLRVSGIPASSIGLAGDTAGMLAFNASYAYYCTANYDGVTNIWRRTAHDVATW
jgi:hypothetical protein